MQWGPTPKVRETPRSGVPAWTQIEGGKPARPRSAPWSLRVKERLPWESLPLKVLQATQSGWGAGARKKASLHL